MFDAVDLRKVEGDQQLATGHIGIPKYQTFCGSKPRNSLESGLSKNDGMAFDYVCAYLPSRKPGFKT